MKYYLITLIICIAVKCTAQEVGIGDKLPVVQLANIINYSKNQALIQEFNNKPLLIQFWGTGCSASVASLQKLDSLQKIFAGQLNILLVTNDPLSEITTLLKKKQVSLPCIAGDSLLGKKYFPHMSIPHEVWIGKDGNIKAITGYESVSVANLSLLVNGKELNLEQKKEVTDVQEYFTIDPLINYRYKEHSKNILFYSFLTAPRKGISYSPNLPDRKDSIKRITLINSTIKELYQAAYDKYFDHPSLVQLNKKWPDEKAEYCYDMIMKTGSVDHFYKRMQDDLKRHFGLTSYIKKQMMPCYILRADSTTGIQPSKYKKNESFEEGNEKVYRYIGMHGIYNQVNQQSLPVLNETGFKKRTDVRLPADIKNIALLKKSLQQSGIILTEENRIMEVIVIE